jgi:malonate transporter and related proteins
LTVLSNIFSVTFPFFGLVLCGYGVARQGWIALEAIPGLNFYVLYVALPAMLWRFAVNTPIASLLAPGLVFDYALCALCMLTLTLSIVRRDGGLGWDNASFGALVTIFPNSGFMGLPLLVALLGSSAVAPVMVSLTFDMVVTTSLCIALSRLDVQRVGNLRQAVRKTLGGILVNPLPWTIFLGSLFSAAQLELPVAVDALLKMLSQSASPVALFTLGCILACSSIQLKEAGAFTRSSVVANMVGLKLLIHPLLVWGISQALIWMGISLDPMAVIVLVLVAALPSAGNVPMLAQRFGADAGILARVVMGSTVFAFLTFTLAVLVMVPESNFRLVG